MFFLSDTQSTQRWFNMALTNKTKERIMPRILFAEDNGNLREVVSDYLSDNGFEVVSVSDGDKAWDKFLDERFDLVLLDVMMPGMSGFDLLRKIRSREDIPVILATAKVQEKDQLLGYSLGADEYVTKPFSLDGKDFL